MLEVLSGDRTLAEASRQHQVKPEVITRWQRQFLENAASVFEKPHTVNGETEARIAELERALGKKALESEPAKKLEHLPAVERRLHRPPATSSSPTTPRAQPEHRTSG